MSLTVMRMLSRNTAHRVRTTGTLIVIAAGISCNWGTRLRNYPATGPAGASIVINVRGEGTNRRGELFAADSTGVTIVDTRIVRIAWSRLAAMDVAKLGGEYDVSQGETPTAQKRARIALVSRFPQGLSSELLARVLVAMKQDAIEEIR